MVSLCDFIVFVVFQEDINLKQNSLDYDGEDTTCLELC